jgi:hypothetical protein
MGFQNVNKVRFYVDLADCFKSHGMTHRHHSYGWWKSIGAASGSDSGRDAPRGFGLDFWKDYAKSILQDNEVHEDTGFTMQEYTNKFLFDNARWNPDDQNDPVYDPDINKYSKKILSTNDLFRNINYMGIFGHNFGMQQKHTPGSDGKLIIVPYVVIQEPTTESYYTERFVPFSASGYQDVINTYAREPIEAIPAEACAFSCDYSGFSLCKIQDLASTGFVTSNAASSGYEVGGGVGPYSGTVISGFGYKIFTDYYDEAEDPMTGFVIKSDQDNYPGQNYFNYYSNLTVSFGSVYDMSVNPNVNIQVREEFDGIDKKYTKGGATLSNIRYTGMPNSATKLHPFLLHKEYFDGENYIRTDTGKHLNKAGRRRWRMKFDLMSDDDVMGALESLTNFPYGEPEYSDTIPTDGSIGVDQYDNPLLTEDNMFSQLILKTRGGQIPFLMQIDSTNNAPDQWYRVRVRRGSFRFTQRSHKRYSIRLDLEETW